MKQNHMILLMRQTEKSKLNPRPSAVSVQVQQKAERIVRRLMSTLRINNRDIMAKKNNFRD